MPYQRKPVDAIQYAKPDGELVAFARRQLDDNDGRKVNKAESDNTNLRQAFFDTDSSIKELETFIEGAKTSTGKPAVIGKTASWGRDDFVISVDTPEGTRTLSPGDWLIKDGDAVRIVPDVVFQAQFVDVT